ncbi:MAG: general secretion pathway protein GspK [Phycisphaeraceae bacterium]|nr:general secretion pathway protein GspK [Phycisphaeraceae bacterium]
MRRRRGVAILLVLWVLVIAAVVIGAVQSTAFSGAVSGRAALSRVRAHWAARAGVEATIARLEYATVNPDLSDAFTVMQDMVDVARGSLQDAAYQVSHTLGGKEVLGPADAHAKINVNGMSTQALMTLPYMTEDVADAILDWIDADDDVNPLGAEVGFYQSQAHSYQPRNDLFRSIQELELVSGVIQEFVRGEDWNLNGRLDPNEDDGNATLPMDSADGVLNAEWSGILTALSTDDVLSASGQARIELISADAGSVARATGMDQDQADVIVKYVQANEAATMADFIRQNLSQLRGADGQPINRQARNLTNEQLALLLDECEIESAATLGPIPGKVNINTCPAEVLEYIPQITPALADAIVLERDSLPKGFTSIVDLLNVPGINRNRLAQLYNVLTVRSNVYVVTCRGRDLKTGFEVEIVATIDRSSLPVRITELKTR